MWLGHKFDFTIVNSSDVDVSQVKFAFDPSKAQLTLQLLTDDIVRSSRWFCQSKTLSYCEDDTKKCVEKQKSNMKHSDNCCKVIFNSIEMG
mmetsp:Transcript_9251/g.12140  ORF Transcript_9251/g.12140 Transcript_9251/m.12140 type:complete len:91 (+) Transcript_9251:130-402(+)